MGLDFVGVDHDHPHPRFPEYPTRVYLDEDDPRCFQLNVGNAAALWRLLGMPLLEDGCVPPSGEVSVHDARRALIRARAIFDEKAPGLVRPEEIEYGTPRAHEDGTVELRPLRMFWRGLDDEALADRLDRFARFVEAVAERGATHVAWQ